MIIPAYTIDPSPRFRKLSVYVYPDGAVRVTAPSDYDPAEVRDFVLENAAWIEHTQRIFFAKKNSPAKFSVTIDDRVIPYTVVYRGSRKKLSIYLDLNGQMEVRAPWDATVESVTGMVERNKDWIRQHLMGNKMPERPTASADGYKDSLTYNGTTIEFSVQFKSSVSRVTIKVKPDRSVAVVAPVTVNRTELHNYILGKADWIHAQVTTTKRQVAVKRKFCDGETYPYLGSTLTLCVTRNKADVSVVLNGLNLVINIPPDVIPAMEPGFIRKCIESMVKSETTRVAVPKVIQFAAAFGVPAPHVDVRLNKGKWGYCSTRGMITFASELCLLPPRLFDYVVAHEVCHRLVMDHSPRFWSTLCTVMPDCQKRRAELKRDSPLYRIFLD